MSNWVGRSTHRRTDGSLGHTMTLNHWRRMRRFSAQRDMQSPSLVESDALIPLARLDGALVADG